MVSEQFPPQAHWAMSVQRTDVHVAQRRALQCPPSSVRRPQGLCVTSCNNTGKSHVCCAVPGLHSWRKASQHHCDSRETLSRRGSHTYHPSTQEAEAGGWRVHWQRGSHWGPCLRRKEGSVVSCYGCELCSHSVHNREKKLTTTRQSGEGISMVTLQNSTPLSPCDKSFRRQERAVEGSDSVWPQFLPFLPIRVLCSMLHVQ
jgi:hypothetical protein